MEFNFNDPELVAVRQFNRKIARSIQTKNAIWWGQDHALDSGKVGSKNANLAHLFQAGLPVPEGFAVPSYVFENRVDKEALLEAIQSEDYKAARKVVESTPVPDEVFKMYDLRFSPSRIAVRSSALAEDSSGKSFAGQLDSFNYQTRDGGHDLYPEFNEDNFRDWGLARAIQKVWASFFSDHAMAYKQDKSDISVAVAVQKQIDPEYAGVAFGANPMNNNLDEHYIEAAPGHGENVVAGLAEDPDKFVLDKDSGKVKSLQGAHMLLNPQQVKQIHQMTHAAHDYFGYPQDIEWAKDKDSNHIHLLQSRDLTTLPHDTPRSPGLKPDPGLPAPTVFGEQ